MWEEVQRTRKKVLSSDFVVSSTSVTHDSPSRNPIKCGKLPECRTCSTDTNSVEYM